MGKVVLYYSTLKGPFIHSSFLVMKSWEMLVASDDGFKVPSSQAVEAVKCASARHVQKDPFRPIGAVINSSHLHRKGSLVLSPVELSLSSSLLTCKS